MPESLTAGRTCRCSARPSSSRGRSALVPAACPSICSAPARATSAMPWRAGSAAAVTLPGVLPQEELARAYASADLFVFPSMIDEFGNAAVEALASGLPALLAAGSGVAARMAGCAAVRVLPGDRPQSWAETIADLAAEPGAAASSASWLAPLSRRKCRAGARSSKKTCCRYGGRPRRHDGRTQAKAALLPPDPDPGAASRRRDCRLRHRCPAGSRREARIVFVLFLTSGVPPRETLWPWQRGKYDRRASSAAARRRRRQRCCSGCSRWGFSTSPRAA